MTLPGGVEELDPDGGPVAEPGATDDVLVRHESPVVRVAGHWTAGTQHVICAFRHCYEVTGAPVVVCNEGFTQRFAISNDMPIVQFNSSQDRPSTSSLRQAQDERWKHQISGVQPREHDDVTRNGYNLRS